MDLLNIVLKSFIMNFASLSAYWADINGDLINKSDTERDKIFTQEKYIMFDESIIINPKYTPIDKIIYYATKHKKNRSYKYIHDLKQSDTSTNAIKRRNAEIKKLKNELKELAIYDNFKGDKIWLEELQKLKKIIFNGYKNGWNYTEPSVKFSN